MTAAAISEACFHRYLAALLAGDRPLFVLGPEWRGGRLIVAVSLAAAPTVR